MLASAACLFANSAIPALADESRPHVKHFFNIQAGALLSGVQTFSKQADIQIITSADLRKKRNMGVTGYLAPENALSRLIEGQGLTAEYVAGGYILRTAKAQTKAPPKPRPAEPHVDEVVVTGYRESIGHALDLKQRATDTEDVILAEDIAAFPDLNLAESLQRIPGITITRDAGEGRQISLRGLSADFTRTQINGMEVLSNTASGMDNRGGVSRTRSFDYSLFASELFDRVTVRKSYSAEQDEGGIGGTVQLSTAKPFDYPDFKAVLSAKGQTNGNTSTLTPRIVGLISDRWGAFGALATIAYSTNDSNEFGYRNWGWSQIHVAPSNIGPGVAAADAARLEATGANEVFAPQAETYSTWFDHRTRLGSTLALQYEPSNRLKLGIDVLFSRLTNERNDYALAAAGTNGLTGDVIGTQVLNSDVIRGNTLVAASYSGVDQRSEYNVMNDTTDFYQAVLNGSDQITDKLSAKGLIGYSKSDYELPVFDKVFLESQNHSFSFDDRPSMPVNTYGFDTGDPAQWNLMRLDTQENSIINDYINAKFDVEYALTGASTLKFGVEYKKFSDEGHQYNDKVFHNVPTDTSIPLADKEGVPYDSLFPYIVGDVNNTYAYIGQIRDLNAAFTMPGTDYRVTEETDAAYLQYDLHTNVSGFPIKANAGLRYFSTALTSAGTVNTGTSLQPATIRHNYDGVLPAFNLAVDLAPDLIFRAGANRDISRPALSDLAAAGSLTTAPFGGTISTGNPNLKPFTADSVEASLEYYQSHAGYFSLGFFYKNMHSFITTETSVVPYSSTGYPLSFLLPGQTGSVIYNVSRPVNGPGASIVGLEAAFQRDFDFLPAPFNHLGIVANATYADGDSAVIFSGAAINLPLFNLSKYSANATLYYETQQWGVRISEAYRDQYLIGAGGNGNIGEGIEATNNVDFAGHYNLTSHLKATLEGVNLTDQHIVQYTDVTARRIEVNTSSGRTILFGATYEF
jgi:iron complex outermembrane receptor protein